MTKNYNTNHIINNNQMSHKKSINVLVVVTLLVIFGILTTGCRVNESDMPAWEDGCVEREASTWEAIRVRDDLSKKKEDEMIQAMQTENTGYKVELFPFYLFDKDIENDKNNKPIFILYYPMYSQFSADYGRLRPRIYFALWNDGKIVWGIPKNNAKREEFQYQRTEIEYFQCQISKERLELFFAKMNEIDAWKYTGKEVAPFYSGCSLFFKYNDRLLRLATSDVSWPMPPHEYPPKRIWSEELFIISDKWRAIINEIEDMIPQKGSRTILPLKYNITTTRWSAYVHLVLSDPKPIATETDSEEKLKTEQIDGKEPIENSVQTNLPQ